MNNTFNIVEITKSWSLAGLTLLLILLSGCATQSDMSRVSKNLNDNKLVPKVALENVDVLNQYQFDYPEPRSALGIYVDFDRANVLAQGGEVFAQVALVSKKAKRRAINFHLLGYDTDYHSNKGQLETILSRISPRFKGKDTVTFNANYDYRSEMPALSTSPRDSTQELLSFLLQFATHDFPTSPVKEHFVLLLGEYETLSHKKKQDIADAVNLFKAKGYRFSLLSYGKEPEFTFIEKLVENGKGQLVILDEFFDARRWYDKEINLVNSEYFTDIKLTLQTMNQICIASIISPTDLAYQQQRMDVAIPELLSDEQKVLMLKIKIPPIKNAARIGVLRVSANYFDVTRGKYKTVHFRKAINYVMDKNQALPYQAGKLARSNHILATHRTINEVADLINDKRNIQAIAELTGQSVQLKKFLNGAHDFELQRDARILDKYAANLKKFDGAWMQQWKIWADLHWDKQRFSERFE